MKRNTSYVLIFGIAVNVFMPISSSTAAIIKNGVSCSKLGSTSKVIVKGKVKNYVCRVNPSIPGETRRTWTLKTCITYWNTAQASQKSIDEQRSLVQVMNEPDKSVYLSELDKSQAELNKVLKAIQSNHCKAGL